MGPAYSSAAAFSPSGECVSVGSVQLTAVGMVSVSVIVVGVVVVVVTVGAAVVVVVAVVVLGHDFNPAVSEPSAEKVSARCRVCGGGGVCGDGMERMSGWDNTQ